MSELVLKTFDECIALADEAKGAKHLLLGNGFSVDLFPAIFNYKVLTEKISSTDIKKLFDKMETSDFEYVMGRLTAALEVVNLYDPTNSLCTILGNDLNALKEILINVIATSHPESPSKIKDEEYESCRVFLSHFDGGKKYTFNYDLLLYWVYMHFMEDVTKQLNCDDGFRHPDKDRKTVTWEIGQEHKQNIYYLHGAMHIFRDGAEIEKYTWTNSGQKIKDQVSESINSQKYPIFISEGTKAHKLQRIQDCSYLGRGFSSLRAIGGNLFIFGHSLRDEDDHVLEIVNSSKLKNTFISLYVNMTSSENQKIIRKINVWQNTYPDKKYYIFDSRTANVWANKKSPLKELSL